jgi:hypothetical protein
MPQARRKTQFGSCSAPSLLMKPPAGAAKPRRL